MIQQYNQLVNYMEIQLLVLNLKFLFLFSLKIENQSNSEEGENNFVPIG